MVFLEAVINSNHVGIGWVSVKRLTLDIVEVHILIIVIIRNSRGRSDVVLRLALENLHSLEVGCLIKISVIVIILEISVIFNVLREASELRVEVGSVLLARSQLLETELETILDGVVLVLLHALVVAVRLPSATESLLLAVLVDAPDLVHAVLLFRLGRHSEVQSRQHSDDTAVDKVHFENS